MAKVEIHGVSKSYALDRRDSVLALKGVNLTIEDGEFVALRREAHRRAELIEAEAAQQIRLQIPGAIEQITARLALAIDENQEIEEYLALRRQQRAKAGVTGGEFGDVVGDEIMQEFGRVGAGDFDDAAILQADDC